MKKLVISVCIFLLVLVLTSCAPAPPTMPSHPENMCTIFQEFPHWYTATKKTEAKWGLPVSAQMAIMYHESSFKKDARPPRTYVLGSIPWSRPTSAYSYSQALDQTWSDYQKSTGNYRGQRDNFFDASDFIGWYAYQSHRKLGVDFNDTYAQYLAYHEGWGGYAKGSYNSQTWLTNYAQHVQARATLYQFQLAQCQPQLEGKHAFYGMDLK